MWPDKASYMKFEWRCYYIFFTLPTKRTNQYYYYKGFFYRIYIIVAYYHVKTLIIHRENWFYSEVQLLLFNFIMRSHNNGKRANYHKKGVYWFIWFLLNWILFNFLTLPSGLPQINYSFFRLLAFRNLFSMAILETSRYPVTWHITNPSRHITLLFSRRAGEESRFKANTDCDSLTAVYTIFEGGMTWNQK